MSGYRSWRHHHHHPFAPYTKRMRLFSGRTRLAGIRIRALSPLLAIVGVTSVLSLPAFSQTYAAGSAVPALSLAGADSTPVAIPQQVHEVPQGQPPQETQVPAGPPVKTSPVPDGPPLKERAVPVSENTHCFFCYERPSEDPAGASDRLGSTYIPVDSFVYPLVLRLYSLGFADTAFIGVRPYTRRSLLHILDAAQSKIMAGGNEEAEGILATLQTYLAAERPDAGKVRGRVYGVDTVYTRFLGIDGQTLRDSFHLGQTIANDYGRPYEPGFNNVTGFSTVSEVGIFSLYVRGEYQHAPSNTGYSPALSAQISAIDLIPYSGYNLNQATIPSGPIASTNTFALQEATLSAHIWGHEISGGKSDAWLGPAAGGAMAWSDNAQDIYSFRINRVDPVHVPFLSDLIGPLRYDFFVGSLKGHTAPNSPWVHSEDVSFAPTPNVRIGFQRTVIWGGEGHEPITLHSFLRSFFSLDDTATDPALKLSRSDPGARYSDFNFSWRLPFLRHYVTLYTDSIAHDDVTPPSAPRRAAYRPGVYIAQFPGLPKLDFRIEAASTDTSTLRSLHGQFNYFESIQLQGYTNKGFIMGDWIGREAKGGQAWLTYHLSPNEWIQIEYLNKKTPKDFIPGGTTENQFTIDVVKRLRKDLELNAWLQYEGWKAPIYVPGNGLNKDTTVAFQFTWFPKLAAPR